jgi:hypothetical protein
MKIQPCKTRFPGMTWIIIPLVVTGAALVLTGSDCAEGISILESVLTQHNDNARTGAYLAETHLKPSTVNPSSFGRLFSRKVDGEIAAQPLYVKGVLIDGVPKNMLYVATRKNKLYAFDTDNTDPNPNKYLGKSNLVF